MHPPRRSHRRLHPDQRVEGGCSESHKGEAGKGRKDKANLLEEMAGDRRGVYAQIGTLAAALTMSDPLLHNIPPLRVKLDPGVTSGTQSTMCFDFFTKRVALEVLDPFIL